MFNFLFDGKIGNILAPVGASSKVSLAIQHHKNLEFDQLVASPSFNPREIDNGKELIHIACRYNNSYALSVLLKLGVNPLTKDSAGNTPLHYAAKYGSLEICKELINNYDCPVYCHNNDRQTPYDVATNSYVRQFLLPLVLKGENATDPQNYGGTYSAPPMNSMPSTSYVAPPPYATPSTNFAPPPPVHNANPFPPQVGAPPSVTTPAPPNPTASHHSTTHWQAPPTASAPSAPVPPTAVPPPSPWQPTSTPSVPSPPSASVPPTAGAPPSWPPSTLGTSTSNPPAPSVPSAPTAPVPQTPGAPPSWPPSTLGTATVPPPTAGAASFIASKSSNSSLRNFEPDGFHSSASDPALQAKYGHTFERPNVAPPPMGGSFPQQLYGSHNPTNTYSRYVAYDVLNNAPSTALGQTPSYSSPPVPAPAPAPHPPSFSSAPLPPSNNSYNNNFTALPPYPNKTFPQPPAAHSTAQFPPSLNQPTSTFTPPVPSATASSVSSTTSTTTSPKFSPPNVLHGFDIPIQINRGGNSSQNSTNASSPSPPSPLLNSPSSNAYVEDIKSTSSSIL